MNVRLHTYLAFYFCQLWSFVVILTTFRGNLMTTK